MSSPKIEYSRIINKYSTQTGVVPTIPSASTLDNSWLPTDLFVGEFFLNIVDDKLFVRTDNGIVEIAMSGVSSDNFYTQYAYLSGNTIHFDRNDEPNAYSVDLSSLVTGATGNYLPLDLISKEVVNLDDNNLLFSGLSNSNLDVLIVNSNKENGIRVFSGGTAMYYNDLVDEDLLNTIVTTPTQSYIETNYSGTTYRLKTQKNGLFIESNTPSSFKGAEYSHDYSANFVDRSLVDKEYVDTAISLSGGGIFTGGTVTGDVIFQGDVIMDELSATTVSILNSGATVRDYFDYSSNLIKTGVTNSSIVAGSGNTINEDLNNVLVAGVNLTATTSDTTYLSNLNVNGNVVGLPYSFAFAASDETTQIETGTSVTTLYAPIDFDVTKVKVSLSNSGSTTTTVDILKNGSSILSSPISLTSGVFINSTTSISGGNFDEDDRITVDVTVAGTDAAGLKIYLTGKSK